MCRVRDPLAFGARSEGVGPRRRLRYAGGGAGGDLRGQRGGPQPTTPSLLAGVRVPGGARTIRRVLDSVSTFRGELQNSRLQCFGYATSGSSDQQVRQSPQAPWSAAGLCSL